MSDDRVLVLSARIVPAGEPGAVMHADLQAPIRINDEARAVLALFRAPATVRDAAAAAGLDAAEMPAFRALIDRFARAALLVPPDEDAFLWREGYALWRDRQPLFLPARAGLLGAHTDEGEADFRIVGVPFDRAASHQGAAAAPSALRGAAAQLPVHADPETGRSRGLLDLADGVVRLAGPVLRDHGDVALDPWAGFEACYDRIERAARHVFGAGGVPVFLGGDHSVTEPILRAWPGEPVTVVHFDAHTDLGTLAAGMPHNHGNVMERLRRLDSVAALVQIGLRDVLPPWWEKPRDVTQIGARRLRSMTPADVVAAIPAARRCYVTIDIDVLDPGEAPATGAPVPGGLRLLELEAILEAVARERDVVGLDLVEVAPPLGSASTLFAALRLLITGLDAVAGRRSRPTAPAARRGRAPRRRPRGG
jgi:agmatinase